MIEVLLPRGEVLGQLEGLGVELLSQRSGLEQTDTGGQRPQTAALVARRAHGCNGFVRGRRGSTGEVGAVDPDPCCWGFDGRGSGTSFRMAFGHLGKPPDQNTAVATDRATGNIAPDSIIGTGGAAN
jgi:hypothetical protein